MNGSPKSPSVMRGLPCKNRKNEQFFARKSGAKSLARRKGFEPLTPRFEVWCSIQLSYRRLQESRQYLLRRGFACQTAENRGGQQAIAGQIARRDRTRNPGRRTSGREQIGEIRAVLALDAAA